MYVQATAPLSIEQHCVAHREALAIGQACQNIQEFCKLQALLRAIYAFSPGISIISILCTIRSAIRIDRLSEVFKVLCLKPIRMKQLHDVRWLSHGQAVKAVVNSYKALLCFFESEAAQDDPTAKGIYKHLKSMKYV